MCWLLRSSSIIPNFDTGGSKFGRSLVSQFGRHFIKFTMYFIYMSSKLRPNFDNGGVEVWSKFGRSLVEGWSKVGRSFDTWGVEVWSKYRPNFDTHIVQNILSYLHTQTILYNENKLFVQQPFNTIVYCLNITSLLFIQNSIVNILFNPNNNYLFEGLSKIIVYVCWKKLYICLDETCLFCWVKQFI